MPNDRNCRWGWVGNITIYYLGADSPTLLPNIAKTSQILYGVWYRIVTTVEISDDGRAAPFTDWFYLFVFISEQTLLSLASAISMTQLSITGVGWDRPQLCNGDRAEYIPPGTGKPRRTCAAGHFRQFWRGPASDHRFRCTFNGRALRIHPQTLCGLMESMLNSPFAVIYQIKSTINYHITDAADIWYKCGDRTDGSSKILGVHKIMRKERGVSFSNSKEYLCKSIIICQWRFITERAK